MEELGEGFFNEYTTDFYEYFDQHLVKNVVKEDKNGFREYSFN